MKNNRKRKSDLGLLLGLLMLITSIILSMAIRKQAIQNASLKSELEAMFVREAVIEQRKNLLNETFFLSMEAAGASLDKAVFETLPDYPGKSRQSLILHLKEDACLDCNQYALISCLERLAGKPNFIVVSHSSNYYFLEEMFFMDVLPANSQIVFYDENLHESGIAEVSAELILADSDLRIQTVFTTDFLGEKCLSEPYYSWIEANANLESFEYRASNLP